MSIPDIEIHRSHRRVHVRLNRPAKRNALTSTMYTALAEAFEAAERDHTTLLLLSGAGPGFCAGNDLNDFVTERPDGTGLPVHRFLRALAASTRIVVAVVQGRAIGIGMTMLLHCDFVIAESDAVLQMPFVDLALVPEAGSSLLVPALVGYQRACRLLMLGEPVDAHRAEALGLVHEVVAAGTGLQAADSLISRLLAKPPAALLACKRLMKSPGSDVGERMALEAQAFAAQLKTPEFAAFVEKFFTARATR
jgi:enoyl-CoA hydratase/carnithine racemase